MTELFFPNSFLFFLTLFYFTILYWFCHTSTWICHRYTCVPHPELSSLLPPHTIPLGHLKCISPKHPVSNSFKIQKKSIIKVILQQIIRNALWGISFEERDKEWLSSYLHIFLTTGVYTLFRDHSPGSWIMEVSLLSLSIPLF